MNPILEPSSSIQNDLSGVLVVDKPAGISSAKVVAIVKKGLSARKVGHTGTLDPFATGVLVCCINDATRLARFFLHDKKKYVALIHLGIATDTQDSTGAVVSTCKKIEFSESRIRSVFKRFEGTIEQLPPVYSALKHKGVPLYRLARGGKPVQKPPRSIFISYIDILDINLPFIRFEVACSSGTYIRTLCADIGAYLGCGGYLKELRRTESGLFSIKEAVPLKEIEELAATGKLDRNLIKMADTLMDMPVFVADDDLTNKIFHGNIITKKDINPELMPGLMRYQTGDTEGFFKTFDRDNNLIAILKHSQGKNRFEYCCVFHK